MMGAAALEVARLERAQSSAKAADKRRVLSDERCELMACMQLFGAGRRTEEQLRSRLTEAARVRSNWERVD